MSTPIIVPGLCGEEMHEYHGYGVYISDATTSPPTFSLLDGTAIAAYACAGVLVAAATGEDGLSTGERCAVCQFGQCQVYFGAAVTSAMTALELNSSGQFITATDDSKVIAWSKEAASSGKRNEAHVNVFQGGIVGPRADEVSASEMTGTTGTWTLTVATNLPSQVRTASSASNGVIHIPFKGTRGAPVDGIKLNYTITAEAANDVAIAVYKRTWGGAGTKATATAVAGAYNTAYDTAGERGAIESHEYTYTFTTPVVLDEDEGLFATVTITDTTGGSAAVSIHAAQWI